MPSELWLVLGSVAALTSVGAVLEVAYQVSRHRERRTWDAYARQRAAQIRARQRSPLEALIDATREPRVTTADVAEYRARADQEEAALRDGLGVSDPDWDAFAAAHEQDTL